MNLKFLKIITLISVLMIIVFIFGYIHYQSSSEELSNDDIEIYGIEYLENYKNRVEKLDNKYWNLFPFYNNYPYKFIGYISSIQGSAIEFVPNKNKGFEIIYIDKEINDYFIGYENKTDILFFFDAEQGYQGIIITNGSFIANGRGVRLIRVYQNTSAFLYLIRVYPEDHNSRYIDFNYVYFKGKSKKVWTLDQARQDSTRHFMFEFWSLFNDSEDFRQYIAIPELKVMIDEINYKRMHNLYPNVLTFKTDINKLIEVGDKKYNVSSDFVNEMYNYEFENMQVQKKWYENYLFILSLIALIFGSLLDFFKITNTHGFIIKVLRKILGFMVEQWRELKMKLLKK